MSLLWCYKIVQHLKFRVIFRRIANAVSVRSMFGCAIILFPRNTDERRQFFMFWFLLSERSKSSLHQQGHLLLWRLIITAKKWNWTPPYATCLQHYCNVDKLFDLIPKGYNNQQLFSRNLKRPLQFTFILCFDFVIFLIWLPTFHIIQFFYCRNQNPKRLKLYQSNQLCELVG